MTGSPRLNPRKVFTQEAPFPLRIKKPKPVKVKEPEHILRFRRALPESPSNAVEVWKHVWVGRDMGLEEHEIAEVIKKRVRNRYGGLLPLWVNWGLETNPKCPSLK